MKAVAVFLFAGAGACRPQGPEVVLAEYREAVANKDARAVLALSDDAFRAAFDEAEVRAELEAKAAPLGGVTGAEQRATFRLDDGQTIALRYEHGVWRVANGGIVPAHFDTPERALETFFRAALAGKLDIVRASIPQRLREAFSTDEALAKHISAMADRIARARSRIGPIAPSRAAIRGEHADLTYGPGQRVTFEKEGERWVIVDLE